MISLMFMWMNLALPPDTKCLRRGRCRRSAQRGCEWSWRAWTSDWRKRRRDQLIFYCRLRSHPPPCCQWSRFAKIELICGSTLMCKLILLILEPLQVNMLQKSLLRQNEEQRRIAALEQQVNQMLQDYNLETANMRGKQLKTVVLCLFFIV